MSKIWFSFFILALAVSVADEAPKHNHFRYSIGNKPHPDKVAKGGEDAFFGNLNVLAVADGVGGWGTHGIDPGVYSKTLCSEISDLLNEDPKKYANNPKKLMHDAWKRDPHIGSATLVIVDLDKKKPFLRTANVGDSGYLIYRKDKGGWRLFFESEEQQKSFNFPFQLAFKPEHGDNPNVAVEKQHTVRNNDIVVVASDGLLDNLDHDQIKQILRGCLGENNTILDVECSTKRLIDESFKYSLDSLYPSPFQKRAEQHGLQFRGGKSDDITVIVGQIVLGTQRDDEL